MQFTGKGYFVGSFDLYDRGIILNYDRSPSDDPAEYPSGFVVISI